MDYLFLLKFWVTILVLSQSTGYTCDNLPLNHSFFWFISLKPEKM